MGFHGLTVAMARNIGNSGLFNVWSFLKFEVTKAAIEVAEN